MPRVMFAMESAELVADLFDDSALQRLRDVVDVEPVIFEKGMPQPPVQATDVDILITGWGAPTFDAATLDRFPRLRAVVHAAGTVKRLVTPELWDRGIRVSSSAAANAMPVAEYTLSMILLTSKDVPYSARMFSAGSDIHAARPRTGSGAFGISVGIVGASRIGRRVLELLRPFDIECLIYDPTLYDVDARALGARLVSLPELLTRSQVVSIHAPALAETHRMIGAPQLALMPDGATLINTARGSLVDTDALVAELTTGRLRAVLDVTDPEPLPAGHPLFSLPDVILTPHIAGSEGNELRRIGHQVVDEVESFVQTGVLNHEVTSPDLARIA